MNLIRNLLSHRSKPAGIPSISWPGESGVEYTYHIHPWDTKFKAVPGNYICAKLSDTGSWTPLYIAQSRDLSQRLEGSSRQDQAFRYGATHIHVHISSGSQAARCNEERDLIRRWQPELNDPIES